MAEQSIYFRQLELGPMQNFIYLIGDPKTREAVVVDPGWEVPIILKTLDRDGYHLTKAIVTHHHFDHVMGLEDLLASADIPVYVHKSDAPHLEIKPSNLQVLSGGETVQVGNIPMTIIHTPGHTQGSQCILVDGRLLSGDTLFVRACGRCDLPDSDPRKLYDSLSNKLRPLDDHTILCPGHNYGPVPTVELREEKQHNLYLRTATLEQFLQLIGYA